MAITDFEPGKRGAGKVGVGGAWSIFGIIAFVGLGVSTFQGLNLVRAGQIASGIEIAIISIVFLVLGTWGFFIQLLANVSGEPFFDPVLSVGQDTQQELSFGFILGFVAWSLLLSGQKIFSSIGGVASTLASIVPVPPLNSIVFSASQQGLTTAQSFFFNGIMAPFVEEAAFLLGIPPILALFYASVGIENKVLRSLSFALIPAFLFSIFHVNRPILSGVWIATFSFRALLQSISFLDESNNIVPGIGVLGTFIFGAHMANNIITLGQSAGGVGVSQSIIAFFVGLSGNPLLFYGTIVAFVLTIIQASLTVIQPATRIG